MEPMEKSPIWVAHGRTKRQTIKNSHGNVGWDYTHDIVGGIGANSAQKICFECCKFYVKYPASV